MTETGKRANNATITDLGIKNATAHWNLSPENLAKIAVEKGQATLTTSGAININTGEFTGRSPKDRFIVRDAITENSVWWGDVNLSFDEDKFDSLHLKVLDYLSGKELYVRNSYACADPKYKMNITVVNEYAWSNLFAYNMFLRPTDSEIENFDSEWTILNAPGFMADAEVDGTRQHNFAILNFTKKIILIGGTGYTGEIKKGIFSALNYILPYQKNVLSMHCSANVGNQGDTAIFFGLSGTGKTTLSADPNRNLIGDDEHGWYKDTVFNFEGGCYAKCIDLSEEKEPDIFAAVRTGALLENISFKEGTNNPNYEDGTITQNTRVSYPIEHINNIAVPSLAHNPKNIFFLTADAFGVLPPVSKLTRGQAMFHFISGYTAKVAGTEAGVTEPQTTFSACFGAPFMPLHPTKYAEMLGEKMDESNVNVWLINTGWWGGGYGTGKRIDLHITRTILNKCIENSFDFCDFIKSKYFDLNFPSFLDKEMTISLNPVDKWESLADYEKTAKKLNNLFKANYYKYSNS